jgi:hypothetical protein
VKLLIDLTAQFKGFNNGDLCLTWSNMEKRGWKSRDTLNKARDELLKIELILISRRGDRRKAQLYALTFLAIDECNGKLDIEATDRPLSLWRKHVVIPPLSPLKIKSARPVSVSNIANMTRPACHH